MLAREHRALFLSHEIEERHVLMVTNIRSLLNPDLDDRILGEIRCLSYVRFAILCIVFVFTFANANAQSFPSKPIELAVAFPSGSKTDAAARVVAQALQQTIGNSVYVRNFNAAQVWSGDLDGYKLLFGGAEVLRVSNFTTDPIGLVGVSPSVVVAGPRFVSPLNLKDRKGGELVAYGARDEDRLLLREMARASGIRLIPIPYKGPAAAIVDLVAERIDLFVGDYLSVKGFADSGKVKIIAASSRPPNAPENSNFPSFPNAGISAPILESFYGLFAPKGIPAALPRRLNNALSSALETKEARQKLSDLGIAVRTSRVDRLRIAVTPNRENTCQQVCEYTEECKACPSPQYPNDWCCTVKRVCTTCN